MKAAQEEDTLEEMNSFEDCPAYQVIDEDMSEEEDAHQEEDNLWRAVLQRVYEGMDFVKGRTAAEVLDSEKELNQIADEANKEMKHAPKSEKRKYASELFGRTFESFQKLLAEKDCTEEDTSVNGHDLRRHFYTVLVKENTDLLRAKLGK